MKFIIISALKSIKRNIRINIVVVLTLSVAYLFLFLICTYIEDGLLGLSSFKLTESNRSVIYEGKIPKIETTVGPDYSREKYNTFFSSYDFIESLTVVEYDHYSDPVLKQEYSIYCVDENFKRHFNFPIIMGRYFTDEEIATGANVCIIGEGVHLRKGLMPGDSIQIGQDNLKVIGVMKYTANMSANLVPYNTLNNRNIPNLNLQGFNLIATLSDISLFSEIDWNSLGLSGNPLTGEEYYRINCDSLIQRSLFLVLIGTLVTLYALINLMNILINKLDQQKKNLSIRFAIGATYRQIFLQFFFENLTLVIAAVGLVFCADPIISELIKKLFNHYFGVISFIAMLVMSVFSSLLITIILFAKFKKYSIVDIVKGL